MDLTDSQLSPHKWGASSPPRGGNVEHITRNPRICAMMLSVSHDSAFRDQVSFLCPMSPSLNKYLLNKQLNFYREIVFQIPEQPSAPLVEKLQSINNAPSLGTVHIKSPERLLRLSTFIFPASFELHPAT